MLGLGGILSRSGVTRLPDGGLPIIYNGVFTPLVTRTRASDMTYIDADGLLKVAGTNGFPVDYCQGFPAQSLWRGSTNLVIYSNDTTGAWNTVASSITPNSGIGPDDTNSAILWQRSASTAYRGRSANKAEAASTAGCVSVYAKRGVKGQHLALRVQGSYPNRVDASFDLENGEVNFSKSGGSGFTVSSVGIQPLANGWYRCWIASSTSDEATTRIGFLSFTTLDSREVDGEDAETDTDGYFTGLQVEEKPYPTPLIITADAAASRAAPSVSITGSAFDLFYNQSEGTFVVDYLQPYQMAAGVRLFDLRNEAGTERHVVEQLSGGNTQYQIRTNGGSTIVNIDSGISQVGERKKTAISYKSEAYGLITTGGSVQSSLLSTLPIIERLNISQAPSGVSGQNNVYINSLTYYPRRLTNTELEAAVNA